MRELIRENRQRLTNLAVGIGVLFFVAVVVAIFSQGFRTWLSDNWLTLIRDFVSIVGFIITVWTLIVARGAQEAARDARSELRINLSRIDAVATLNVVLVQADTIYDLQSRQSWHRVPELYKDIRHALGKLAGAGAPLQPKDINFIMDTNYVFAELEIYVEANKNKPVANAIPRLNSLLSERTVELRIMESKLGRKQEET